MVSLCGFFVLGFYFFCSFQEIKRKAFFGFHCLLSTITHISTDVYFDIDCLSWVFHNRASSLLLLLTVLASLSILVGDAEQQHSPTFLFYKNALLFQILKRFYVCLFFLIQNTIGLSLYITVFNPHEVSDRSWRFYFSWLAKALRITECIFPEAELKAVSLWNWPKQELREKNWSAMEALSATESMLQGKLSKAVKVRHPLPLSLLHSSFNLKWPSEISFSTIIHNKAAYSFASLLRLLCVWPQVFNWLCVELLLFKFATLFSCLKLL